MTTLTENEVQEVNGGTAGPAVATRVIVKIIPVLIKLAENLLGED